MYIMTEIDKRKYTVYENDLKFLKKDIDVNFAEWHNKELEKKYYNTAYDSIDYRIEENKKENYAFLDLSQMNLYDIPPSITIDIKKKVKHLFINNNNFNDLNLCDFINLESIDVSYNNLTNLNGLPISINEISCCNNKITVLPPCDTHKNMKHLTCKYNKIKEIPNYKKLETIVCNNNEITKLNNYPLLKYLECSNNPITLMPSMASLVDLIASNTKISFIGKLESVRYIEILDVKIESIDYSSNLEDFVVTSGMLDRIDVNYKIKNRTIYKKKNIVHYVFAIKI